ncbi:MAG: GNAT family N-acetyltransferase [Lachnospiraceae bacterium]|nr:GNAT family N-acetyltransferase [Lachnospiraceae bacterium]
MKSMSYLVRPIQRNEWEDAMQLAWDTFLIYEAPEYSREGINSFRNFIRDPILKRMFIMGEYIAYGAFINEQIAGIIGIRNTSHISLLFVETGQHHRGIATALVRHCVSKLKEHDIKTVTVNSSPYAVGFYHRIGFVDTSEEIVSDGIRYTPMKLTI